MVTPVFERMVDRVFMEVNGLYIVLIVKSVIHCVVIFFVRMVVATVLVDVI